MNESLQQHTDEEKRILMWYKDGIVNCADAFLLQLREEGMITEKQFHNACIKFGELGNLYGL